MAQQRVGVLRDLASQVLSHVTLEQVLLVGSSTQAVLPAARGGVAELEVNAEIGVKGTQPNGSDVVQTWLRYEVTAADANDAESDAWQILSEWVAEFRGDSVPKLSPHQLEAFALVIGPPTVHPYVRQFVQDVVSRGPYPAFTLGLLTPVTALPDDEMVDVGDSEAGPAEAPVVAPAPDDKSRI